MSYTLPLISMTKFQVIAVLLLFKLTLISNEAFL